jgi:hypothetical protein
MDELPPLTGSAKNELIGRLKAASEPSIAASASKPTSNAQDENRALFMSAMSDPVRRQIAFNVVERNCKNQFAEGADGVQLYVRLLTYVRLTNATEAVDEFERRLGHCSIRQRWRNGGQSRRH